MNSVSEPHILFTKNGNLQLSFKGTNETVLLKEIKMKFGNKMGFLVSLFDLPVELETEITFNQILHNLKFFEKEFETLFSEIKIPKNNSAAQKIFELLKNLNKENINFLSIMNEERNSLENSLIKHNINDELLSFIKNKNKNFEDTFIIVKKIMKEKQTKVFGKEEIIEKKVSLITRAQIYVDNEVKDLNEMLPLQILSAQVMLDEKSPINYTITFEDILKSFFKDLLIFRSKEEIKIWIEDVKQYQKTYAKNVVYLNDMQNIFKNKGESMSVFHVDFKNKISKDFGKGDFSKPFGKEPKKITKEEEENIKNLLEKNKKEMMRFFEFLSQKNMTDLKSSPNLKLVSCNENIVSEKSNAQIKRIK